MTLIFSFRSCGILFSSGLEDCLVGKSDLVFYDIVLV